MNREKAIELLQEFASGNLTPMDEELLQEWINTTSLVDIQEVMQKYEGIVMKLDKGVPDPVLFQKIKERIAAEEVEEKEKTGAKVYPLNDTTKATKFPWRNVAAAAVVILILAAGSYFIFNKNNSQKQIAQSHSQKFYNDITPGGNKAILTLANGSQIVLDSAAVGTLANQGNVKIIKLDSGQLAYNGPQTKEILTEISYNTISTPRGGQYQLTLSDGTKVWLNAASSLRFPASFVGKERKVELTGEGYFQVVHNSTQPFTVSVNGMEVHDIGTAFNINAYRDEPVIKTTLISGGVRVTELKTRNSKLLKPGQQALVSLTDDQNPEHITIKPADIAEAIGWKNGKFQFGEGTDIATIMRQIARWYDVDVEYKGKITGHIGGSISRNVNASKVLNMLEKTGSVKFKIEGKKVIVMSEGSEEDTNQQ
jgi:ferric-dicitrate binding protein FerR (iron transport regulator)